MPSPCPPPPLPSRPQVSSMQHTIDGHKVEAKRVPRDPPVSKNQQAVASWQRTTKIFVGDLAASVDKATLRAYFEDFGAVSGRSHMTAACQLQPCGIVGVACRRMQHLTAADLASVPQSTGAACPAPSPHRRSGR